MCQRSLLLLIKSPGFSHGDPTMMTLDSPDHIPRACINSFPPSSYFTMGLHFNIQTVARMLNLSRGGVLLLPQPLGRMWGCLRDVFLVGEAHPGSATCQVPSEPACLVYLSLGLPFMRCLRTNGRHEQKAGNMEPL